MADESVWSQVAGWVWQRREDVLQLLKGVAGWFSKLKGVDGSQRGILILGAGGVGKTTLARILSGQFDWLLDDPWKYEESHGIERVALSDDPKVQVVIPPGQGREGRRETTWPGLLADLAAGRYRGVILMSAYGFHSFDIGSYKDHPLYARSKEALLAALTDQNRKDELAILRRLVPHLTAAGGKLWLLSVVTKEDLWVDERQEVEKWLAGEYRTQVALVSAAKGAATFRHEAARVSLVISNLVTDAGEVLRRNTAGYDHRRSVESVRRLLEVVNALRAWEDEK